MALKLGCSAKRCHTLEFSEYKWLRFCANQCWQQKVHRKRLNLICKKCGSKVVYKKIIRNYFTSSSSINVPEKSDGLKKITGFPCAPIFGLPSPRILAPADVSFLKQLKYHQLHSNMMHATIRVFV